MGIVQGRRCLYCGQHPGNPHMNDCYADPAAGGKANPAFTYSARQVQGAVDAAVEAVGRLAQSMIYDLMTLDPVAWKAKWCGNKYDRTLPIEAISAQILRDTKVNIGG